ncbi:MAG: CRISPR-associated endonuclease Cas2 [Gammaproteobacteria bacterium]|nr:CRISPR-associated endonuclease Cas2 [Gammaproteobacteria bacterium]
MTKYPVVIAYDVSCNRRRRKVAQILKGWRLEGQYSVVESYVTHKEASELMIQLSELIDPTTDSVLMGRLHDIETTRGMAIGQPAFQQFGMIRVH